MSPSATAAFLRLALAGGAALGLLWLGWLALSPNRILPAQALPAPEVLGWPALALAAAAFGGAFLAAPPRQPWLSLLILLATTLIALFLTGSTAAGLLVGRPPAARVMVGAGFWVTLACLGALMVEAARATGARLAGPAALLGLAAGFALLAASGILDALSLAVEARARADTLSGALLRHLLLSGGTLLLALALALPLAVIALGRRRMEGLAGAGLNAVQVVPAIAMLGLLVSLLSLALAAAPGLRAWGLSAIGPAPTLIAVGLYAALPLFRATLEGLRSADPAAVEAGRAMGMGEGRITLEIRLPLGAPVLLAGLRLAAVQSVGLVTLGGLIGAGGLGAVVFEGMSAFAQDVIILGAALVIALALAVDGGFRALEAGWRARSGLAPAGAVP